MNVSNIKPEDTGRRGTEDGNELFFGHRDGAIGPPVDTVVLVFVDNVGGDVEGVHFRNGIRKNGTENEHSDMTEVIDARLCQYTQGLETHIGTSSILPTNRSCVVQ